MLIGQLRRLPEAAEAVQLAAEIKSNPEWAKQACDQMSDRLGVLYLALADTWLKKGQPQQAVFYLERVVQNFPHLAARRDGPGAPGADPGGAGVARGGLQERMMQ